MECFRGWSVLVYFDCETKGQKATLFKPGSHLYPQYLERQRQENCPEFKVSLSHRVRS